MSGRQSTRSLARLAHHSSTCTRLARAWSATASPVGRYGAAVKAASRSYFADAEASRASCAAGPPPVSATARRVAATAAAVAPAAVRSRSPADRGESSSTAAVAAAEASHQPSSRETIVATPPAEATGRTEASSAAVTPEAAFGPATPAKKMANVTGMVTIAASHGVPLTAVPITRAMLPAVASPRWATALSRLVPPKLVITRVAKPPKTANKAICGSAMTLSVSANKPGTTIVARTARAAGADHAGRQPAHRDPPGRASAGPAPDAADRGPATTGLDISPRYGVPPGAAGCRRGGRLGEAGRGWAVTTDDTGRNRTSPGNVQDVGLSLRAPQAPDRASARAGAPRGRFPG